MLFIDIPQSVYEVHGSWNGKSKKLITVPAIHLEMEHSLLSISKWESKWKIPYVERISMTSEQFLDYCRCMTANKPKVPEAWKYLRQVDAEKIGAYISDSMSARVMSPVKKNGQNRSGPRMTSEYFYWLMIQLGIPFECEKWHFGRLLALIDCCQNEGGSGSRKPMSYRERQQFYNELNNKRRKALGTKG